MTNRQAYYAAPGKQQVEKLKMMQLRLELDKLEGPAMLEEQEERDEEFSGFLYRIAGRHFYDRDF